MPRSTIDFGIDLGTTNSEIAVFNGGETEIIKNNDNFDNTPSAVWYDAKGRLEVGRKAKEMHEYDADNAKIEFKRQMGKPEPIEFRASGRKMLPEELSAEVLKQLKANVKEHLGEDIAASVITVPADFNAAQIEATNRAARLAGIESSPLLQEPIAAAMAYGFQRQDGHERSRVLVYDLGGGTFDAALMHKRDGLIHVENHGGDKYLGGKDLDYSLVQDLMVPALLGQAALGNFTRNNPKWTGAFAKLKIHAEDAKIRLSRAQSALIDVRDLCKDDRGQKIDFELEIHRADLERLAEPLIAKSINICRQILAERHLGPQDIEKVILVGGPTLMPYLRQRLADGNSGLGIPLEFRVDPFTVVARGAAIFAGTHPLAPSRRVPVGELRVILDYKAIGPDAEVLVSGQIVPEPPGDLSRHTIEFLNRESSPPWRSGKIALSDEGRFLTGLQAEPGRQNFFQIELLDATGARRKTSPDRFPYTVGEGGIAAQTLIHRTGIGLADNSVHPFFEKGTPLPARHRDRFQTTVHVPRGSPTTALKVPVIEGEEGRADRCEEVGTFTIPGTKFSRDVPAGSEIEVTIEVDESRRFMTRVYIPILDEEFEAPIVKNTVVANADVLASKVQEEKQRLAGLREKADKAGEAAAATRLRQIADERLEHDVDSALTAARSDEDARDKCASRLRDLQVALDAVEDSLKWPGLVAEAEEKLKLATDLVQKHGSAADKRSLIDQVRDVREAIQARDAELLESRSVGLMGFAVRIYRETDEFAIGSLVWLQEQKDKMRDRAQADRLLGQGLAAARDGNLDGVRTAVDGLRELLPAGDREHGPFGGKSTLIRV